MSTTITGMLCVQPPSIAIINITRIGPMRTRIITASTGTAMPITTLRMRITDGQGDKV